MEFINKNNQVIFHPYYTTFEINKWDTTLKLYNSYNYSGFTQSIKSSIKGSLIDEQNGLCCYCLKELEKNDSSTIEHLYPNNPQTHNVFSNYNITCIEKRSFNFSTRQVPNNSLNNLPHDISYYNLLACCKLCNNTRDTKEIEPFIFDTNVKSEFLYNDNGNIFSAKYQNEITNIGLASDQYVNYRKLWRHLRKSYDESILSDKKKLEKAVKKVALELFKNTKNIFFADFINNGFKVKEAIEYKYFYY